MATPDLISGKEPKFIAFEINGNDIGSRGVGEINFYESILSVTSSMSVDVIDAGGGSFSGKQTNILSGLPLRGGEGAQIILEDSYGQRLTKILFVNTVSAGDVGTQKLSFSMDLFPPEHFSNEQTRVVKRYDGKISESIKSILKDPNIFALTESDFEIEDSENVYNFIGNDRKPLYVIDWLSTKAIPSGKTGSCAGFFFFHANGKYQFKSVDMLLAKQPKRKYRYTGTPANKSEEIGTEYFGRILKYSIKENINIQNKMQVGTYNTRILYFDPYSFKVDAVINSAIEKQQIAPERSKDSEPQQVKQSSPQKDNANTAAEKLDFIDKKFLEKPCRLMCVVKDNGNLPSGTTAEKQLESWKQNPNTMNDQKDLTLHQSIARFNQLFSNKISITVPGDFSLHAGDMIYCEFPNPSADNPQENYLNRELSGNYLIADVNQSVTRKDHYTYLNLVRDSVGWKK